MYMPSGGKLEEFSFTGREYLTDIYDTSKPRVLLMCGRQVEKSTTLGNQILAYTSLQHYFRSLYVSPTETQTQTFSRDKISTPIKYSDKLKFMKGRSPTFEDNVLYKRFITDSDITMRYAFLNADRCRGISAHQLLLDELQDLLVDVIPVIEEVLSHSEYKYKRYAGTPKSVDNTINYYWENYSTQNEWVVPCEGCNHWNIPSFEHIGKHFLICSKCGKQIYAGHPRAQWASMRDDDWRRNPRDNRGKTCDSFEGYRISQLTVPWVEWTDIHSKMSMYDKGRFMNEVLGQAFDSSDRLMSKAKLFPHCTPSAKMVDAINFAGRSDLYMGVDWGGYGQSETSFTVVSIGGFLGGKFTYIYFKRFEAAEADSDYMIAHIIHLAQKFHIHLIGTDYGGGQDNNRKLISAFSIKRILRYQYVETKRLYFDKALMRFMVNRTEALMSLVNAIHNGLIAFPRWEDIEYPFMGDLMALYREWNSRGTKVMIQRSPGSSDDSAHSMLYCLLASMVKHPRPDILTPSGLR